MQRRGAHVPSVHRQRADVQQTNELIIQRRRNPQRSALLGRGSSGTASHEALQQQVPEQKLCCGGTGDLQQNALPVEP